MQVRKKMPSFTESRRPRKSGRRMLEEVDQEAITIKIPPPPRSPQEFIENLPMEERDSRGTKPEIPSLKGFKADSVIAPPQSLTRKKSSTMPSPGNDENGLDEWKSLMRDLNRLSSVRKAVAERAAVSLIESVGNAESARAVLNLLPSSESPAVESVRGHCLGLLKSELDKVPPSGAQK